MNIKNISLFLGILASIFMFEGRNFEQGPFYVIVWPLVTPDHDQSNCLPVIVKLTLGAFIWVVTHQIPSKTDRSRSSYICPTPNFVRHFESQRTTLIIEYLPWVLAASGLNVHLDVCDAPAMSLYSDQVRNRRALSGMQMTPGSRITSQRSLGRSPRNFATWSESGWNRRIRSKNLGVSPLQNIGGQV